MPADNALGDYLRARRELVLPAERGLPDLGRRRVPGLRREEVAMLAGISAEYYVRLERGRDRHPSMQVVEALARVLDLDAESTAYLASLAVPAPRPAPRRTDDGRERVPAAVLAMLDAMPPAFVLGRFLDVLAANRAAEVLHGGPPAGAGGNVLRHVFLDPVPREQYPDRDEVAAEAVAALRAAAAGHADDAGLASLVGEMSLKSAQFRRLWARHEVRAKTSGVKRLLSPTAGLLTLQWESLSVASAPGQIVVVYSAEPGSDSEQALARVVARARDRTGSGRTTPAA
jgi:transcriptional regulator with XRE-family HTH domain